MVIRNKVSIKWLNLWDVRFNFFETFICVYLSSNSYFSSVLYPNALLKIFCVFSRVNWNGDITIFTIMRNIIIFIIIHLFWYMTLQFYHSLRYVTLYAFQGHGPSYRRCLHTVFLYGLSWPFLLPCPLSSYLLWSLNPLKSLLCVVCSLLTTILQPSMLVAHAWRPQDDSVGHTWEIARRGIRRGGHGRARKGVTPLVGLVR